MKMSAIHTKTASCCALALTSTSPTARATGPTDMKSKLVVWTST